VRSCSQQGHSKAVFDQPDPKLGGQGYKLVVELEGRHMTHATASTFLFCAHKEEAALKREKVQEEEVS